MDENWAEGMLADKIGIFPISYVEVRKQTRFFSLKLSAIIYRVGAGKSNYSLYLIRPEKCLFYPILFLLQKLLLSF